MKRMHSDQKQLLDKSYGFDAAGRDILAKFVKACRLQEAPKFFPPPRIPEDFEFKHVLAAGEGGEARPRGASDRAELLGERAMGVESVLDLVSEEDRQFLAEQRQRQAGGEAAKRLAEREAAERKAGRYAEFVIACRRGELDAYAGVETAGLTEWERQSEREEFAGIYGGQVERGKREAGAGAAMRAFVSGEREEKVPQVMTNELDSAVGEKRFGVATRKEYEFRPHPTLCKRFNVPDPYPK